MNEKIKELVLKNVQHLDWDPPSEPKEYTFTSDGLDQFAQSIIAECCVALHPMLRDMISRTQGVDMIVNHFRSEQDVRTLG